MISDFGKKLSVEEINQIIKDEFESTEQAEHEESIKESESQTQVAFQVVFHFVNKTIEEPLPYYFSYKDSKTLANIIKSAGFNAFYAHIIYKHIVIELKGELRKLEESSKEHKSLLEAINDVESYAFRFFGEYLEDVFKDVHIAGILFTIKKYLATLDKSDYEYLRKPLLEMKNNVELRIRLRKEEKQNRDTMFEPPENENIGIENESLRKHKDLTQDRSILFMDYLFRFYGLECQNTDKARVISFLTGYSEKKIAQRFSALEKEKLDLQEKTELSEKFAKDVEVIRKYFKILGLTGIEGMVNEDLGLDCE